MSGSDERPELAQSPGRKLPYEKPVLRSIELAAEEVLAGGCKMDKSMRAGFGRPACVARPCVGRGS